MKRTSDSDIPLEVRAALSVLRREGSKARQQLFAAVCAWSSGMVSFLLAISRIQSHANTGLFFLFLSVLLLVVGVLLLPRPRSQALTTLARWRDVRAIVPLLDALTISVGIDRPRILNILTDILPRLEEADANLFTRSQRRKLMDALHFSDNHQEAYFQVAVIKALARIGDEDALRLMRGLAVDAHLSEYERMVRDAARENLPLLLDRVERLRQSHHLLRPSVTEDASAELLRPTTATEESAPETLLRPTQNG
jgi:hypothetical protein